VTDMLSNFDQFFMILGTFAALLCVYKLNKIILILKEIKEAIEKRKDGF
jgi:hypothetical protein